jgi:hypothetical protein
MTARIATANSVANKFRAVERRICRFTRSNLPAALIAAQLEASKNYFRISEQAARKRQQRMRLIRRSTRARVWKDQI